MLKQRKEDKLSKFPKIEKSHDRMNPKRMIHECGNKMTATAAKIPHIQARELEKRAKCQVDPNN